MIFALLSFLFFIALEAFFALSEMALISAERLSLQKRAKNERIARIALKLLDNPERLFTTTIMGITMSIAGNAIFTSYFLISSLGNAGAIFSLIIPIFTFLFGQAFPKVIGKVYSQTLVLIVAPILYLLSFLFYPVYYLNQRLTNLIFRKKEDHSTIPFIKFREVFLSLIKYEEEIDAKERELMHKIFEFSKKKVYQVMIPLPQVKALPLTATLNTAIEFCKQYNFSYIPLYKDNPTNLIGVVRVKDLLSENKDYSLPISKFMIEPLFIPENIQAYEALAIMQNSNQDFAIVVDEYGLTTGIITLEDLAEEVLGEFSDQLDYQHRLIIPLSDKTYLAKGIVEIEKLSQLGLEIPSSEFETLNGFLYSLFKRIPETGESIRYKNFEFMIKKATPTTVEEVLIRRVD